MVIWLGATLVQLLFWGLLFSRLAFYRSPTREPQTTCPAVSVIICARNEAQNLARNLPHFLNQNYRSFEIVVVNDNSTDTTEKLLLYLQKKYSNLRLISLNTATPPGKKAALAAGINAAANEVLLFSDADCFPATPNWLRDMQYALKGEKEIVLGYGPYLRRAGWLNRFIRYETAYTAIQYLSFALAGIPYMGVGRNLAYTRSLFLRNGGFTNHLHLASGDDDLFVNQVADHTNTTIALRPTTFVYSAPRSSWRGYYYQKSRHLTTGTKYRPMHQLMLGALSASHFLHYAGAAFLLGYGQYIFLVIILALVRMGVVSFLGRRIFHKLNETDLGKWMPLLDAAYLGYYLLFAPVLLIGNVKQWK